MIYRYEDIRQLQIEGTPVCNADCPMCIRRNEAGATLPALAQPRMTPDDYKKLLSPELTKQLTSVLLCGNYGDACLMGGFYDILERLRLTPHVVAKIETNGGMHNPPWWKKLAALLNPGSRVVFNIDGLEDTQEIYRRNVPYAKVIENAQAFIKAGGRATWAFLPFEHNEHQVREAGTRAKDMGFDHFEVRVTERFYRNDGQHLPEFKKNGATLRPAKNPQYRYTRSETPQEYLQTLRTCNVSCRATKSRNVYIDFMGNVFPCCFTAAILGNDCEDLGTTMIRERFATLKGKRAPNLKVSTLRDIVNGDMFQWIGSMLNTPDNRPVVCSAVCGAGLFKTSK